MSRPEELWDNLSGSDPMAVCRMMFQFWDVNDVEFRPGRLHHILRKSRFWFETKPKLARRASGVDGVDEMFNMIYSTLSAGSTDTGRTMMDVYRLTSSMYGYRGTVALSERIWDHWPASDKWLLLTDILACLASILPQRDGFRLSDPKLEPFLTELHGFFRNKVFGDSQNPFHQPESFTKRYELPLQSAILLQHAMHGLATAVASGARGRSRNSHTTIRHCYLMLLRFRIPILRSLPIALVQTSIIEPIVNGTGYTDKSMEWVLSLVRRYESDAVADELEDLAAAWQVSAREARRLSAERGEPVLPTAQEVRRMASSRRAAAQEGVVPEGPATATATEPAAAIGSDGPGEAGPNYVFCQWPPLRRAGQNWVMVDDG
jgi:hypothetical protein